MISIKPAIADTPAMERYLGLLKVPLSTYSLRDYRLRYMLMLILTNTIDIRHHKNCVMPTCRFPEVHVSVMQFGLDDAVNPETALRFSVCRHAEGEGIAQGGNTTEARLFLRQGCPPSLRNRLW